MRNILILTIALMSAACGPKEATVENMADDMCKCLEPAATAYTAMTAAPDDITTEAMAALVQKFNEEVNAFETCITGLEEIYGTAMDEQEEAIRGVMHVRCSDVADIMDEMDNAVDHYYHD